MEFHFFWRFMSKSLFDATLYCFCSTKFRDKFIGPWKLLWYVRNRSKMYKFFLNMNRLQHFDMKIGVALVLQEIPKFQKLFYIIFIRKTCWTEKWKKWGKWWIILPLLKPFFNWQNWTICLRFRPPNLRIFLYPLENICPWFTIIKIIQNPFWLEWNHTIDISTFAKSVATRSLLTTKVALILSKKGKGKSWFRFKALP